MAKQNQFYIFYKTYLDKISKTIFGGKVAVIVGINGIGKNLLVEQLKSGAFSKDYVKNKKVKLIFLEFKDKYPPTAEQLYKYWLTQTAKEIGYKLPTRETFNEFSFYTYLSNMSKNIAPYEKLAFVILDAQQILDQSEVFYRSLLFLHKFSYGKVSYVFLSEPQILHNPNPWLQKFIQHLTNNKFIFLKPFDIKTSLANIKRQEKLLSINLEKYYSFIIKYSRGLHGVIDAFCYFIKNNPQIHDIRIFKKLIYEDKLIEYWVIDVLNSLPIQSLRILKSVSLNKSTLKKHKSNIYGKWLIEMGFLKKSGTIRYPLMLPILKNYTAFGKDTNHTLKLHKSKFCIGDEVLKLTKKEFVVLEILNKRKGKLVTYDAIGNVLWKENSDDFSLWAISQIIRRLRKRLAFYSLNPNIISSQRGEGYILN